MVKQIGFVILSHTNPSQTFRLIRSLQRVYGNPVIVCHHDFGQSAVSPQEFPSGTYLVTPHVKTSFGHFSVVTAMLRGLELLYQIAEPDWFFLLSGADYPTLQSEKVIDDLVCTEVDALLDYREVPDNPTECPGPRSENPALQVFSAPSSLEEAWTRYIGFKAWSPVIRSGPRLGRHTTSFSFKKPFLPFSDNFKCFFGDHWFAGNQKTAQILRNPKDRDIRLRRHLRWRYIPEECYYQTVLGNAVNLKISKATKRFAKWRIGSLHPEVLGLDDLPDIISMKAHFARKFAADSPVLDEIDRMLT